uniref:Insulin-like growth factor 1 receptor (inferred by orthology to a human protein) n=1 Tax=Strongyloides venezuelensis TaxID=75913 RepID=A0A0K0FJ70_STRVS
MYLTRDDFKIKLLSCGFVSGFKLGPCVIKTVRESASPAEKIHFIFEASVMKKFHTSFIVNLYGVVSESQSVLVYVEMIEKKNLRDILKSYRLNSEINVDYKFIVSSQKSINWAAQIADNLAARNRLVHRNKIVEIGDFDMARYIYYHEYYQPTGKRSIPVRWVNQDSLKDGKFSVKLAQQPCAGLDNPKVFEYIVKSRKILSGPQGCADFWHNTMKYCWRYNPSDRPSFFQIFIYKKKEELEEVDNHDGKEDNIEDDDEEDDENENKNESDIGNHLEVIDEDNKSEYVILVLPKKRVRISTPDNNAL